MLYWRGERDEGSGQHRRSHARHRCHGPDAGRRRSHPPNCYVAGVYNCGSTIIREEGARSLWKGLTPFAGNLTLKYFLRFGTNAFYQNLLRDAVRFRLTPLAALCNGRSEGCKMLTLTMLIWHTCIKAICMPTVGPVRRAAALRLIVVLFRQTLQLSMSTLPRRTASCPTCGAWRRASPQASPRRSSSSRPLRWALRLDLPQRNWSFLLMSVFPVSQSSIKV